MIYLERRPNAQLAPFVRLLWYARDDDPPRRRQRVLPTGCVQVILTLARDFLLDCPEGASDCSMAPALVVGARSIYELIDTTDLADLIGVVFTPGGFSAFADEAAHLFSNRSVPLSDLWGSSADLLREQLLVLAIPEERLCCLERFLVQRLSATASRNALVTFALDRFRKAPGVASVRDVARSSGWSERRFSQVFREEVGLTPKTWCRVQRFQRAVQQLHAGVDLRWAELALECGYYDQSHFANEFRAFSGVNPTTYSAGRTRWTNHLSVE